MKLDITGIHIEVTDAIKDFAEKKLQKLDKFFDDSTICHVTFTDKSKGKQRLDIRIEYKSRTYLAESETDNLYSGIEQLISKIEGQIKKDKSMAEKSRREGLPEIEQVEDDEDIEE